ncbi:MAG: hypothetical protein ACPGUC_04280 [Gammaproteobacteria bacterium]
MKQPERSAAGSRGSGNTMDGARLSGLLRRIALGAVLLSPVSYALLALALPAFMTGGGSLGGDRQMGQINTALAAAGMQAAPWVAGAFALIALAAASLLWMYSRQGGR